MIHASIYLCAGLSVLIALWVMSATFKFVATAFKALPEFTEGSLRK